MIHQRLVEGAAAQIARHRLRGNLSLSNSNPLRYMSDSLRQPILEDAQQALIGAYNALGCKSKAGLMDTAAAIGVRVFEGPAVAESLKYGDVVVCSSNLFGETPSFSVSVWGDGTLERDTVRQGLFWAFEAAVRYAILISSERELKPVYISEPGL